jgi:hypothetical protein
MLHNYWVWQSFDNWTPKRNHLQRDFKLGTDNVFAVDNGGTNGLEQDHYNIKTEIKNQNWKMVKIFQYGKCCLVYKTSIIEKRHTMK